VSLLYVSRPSPSPREREQFEDVGRVSIPCLDETPKDLQILVEDAQIVKIIASSGHEDIVCEEDD